MPKRTLRGLAALVAGITLVTACGGGDEEAGGGADGGGGGADLPECPLAALEEASGPVEVTVWHTYVGRTEATLEALAEDYNASQDTVVVDVQSQGNNYEELLAKYEQGIPTENLPGIAITEDNTVRFLADSGTVTPAQACVEADEEFAEQVEDFLPIAREYYTIDDVLWPGTMNVSTLLMYYNRTHFSDAGLDPDAPPQTLEELRAAAEAIKAAKPNVTPLAFKLDSWFIEHWLTGAGASMVNEDNGRADRATESEFDNETTREVLQWLQDMQNDGLLNAVPGTPGQFDHYFAIALGNSSMVFETSTAVTTVTGVLEGTFDPADLGVDDGSLDAVAGIQLDIDLGAAKYPGVEEAGKGQVGGGIWMVPNTNDEVVQGGAFDFIKFVNQPENAARWNTEGSYLPVREAATEVPELQENWETTLGGGWLSIAYDAMLNTDPEFPGPVMGPYQDIRNRIRTGLDEMILNGQPVDEVLPRVDEQITGELQEYNDENF